MKVVMLGREMKLDNREFMLASKAINGMLDAVQKYSAITDNPRYYLTFLLAMYTKSINRIEAISPDALQYMLDLIDISSKTSVSNTE